MPDFVFQKTCAHCGLLYKSQWRKAKTCSYACAKAREATQHRERDRKRRARQKAEQLVGERERASDAVTG
jgi:hypothetical protein